MSWKRWVQASILTIGILCLAACGSTAVPLASSGVDVYLAGFEYVGSANVAAVYWKNGNGVSLTTDATHADTALGIAVSGSDVYVIGNSAAPGRHQEAIVWKNGVATALTDGTKDGYASGISVSGSDVYVSGSEIGLDASGNTYSAAEYWKNGKPTILSNSSAGQEAFAIFVSGSDVYVAGYQYVTKQTGPSSFTTNPVALYWKNGVPVQLTSGATAAGAYSIFVAGTDVYVSGYNCLTMTPDCGRAAYWINGALVQLPTTNFSTAASIAASGGNVYVADNEVLSSNSDELAALWTNGTEKVLNETDDAASNAVVVSGSDVYVAGASGPYAGYFKNGGLESVRIDANTESSAFAIAVVPK